MINVSGTIGDDQMVGEVVVRFMHTRVIEWMLLGVAPTGKRKDSKEKC